MSRLIELGLWGFAKVNRVRFSLQGNKFGAGDGDGNVAFWQAVNATSPFFVSTRYFEYSRLIELGLAFRV